MEERPSSPNTGKPQHLQSKAQKNGSPAPVSAIRQVFPKENNSYSCSARNWWLWIQRSGLGSSCKTWRDVSGTQDYKAIHSSATTIPFSTVFSVWNISNQQKAAHKDKQKHGCLLSSAFPIYTKELRAECMDSFLISHRLYVMKPPAGQSFSSLFFSQRSRNKIYSILLFQKAKSSVDAPQFARHLWMSTAVGKAGSGEILAGSGEICHCHWQRITTLCCNQLAGVELKPDLGWGESFNSPHQL